MLRKLLFWLHLSIGLLAGLVIASMCVTGALIAFQHEIVEWAEHADRTVAVPEAGSPRLPLAELQKRFKAALPKARLNSVHVSADPAKAVLFRYGSANAQPTTAYANPYTGEINIKPRSLADRGMRALVEWHRWLGLEGERRKVGKALTGTGTLLFICLLLSGLWLWWPRCWSWRRLRSTTLPDPRARGRRFHFNWHHAIGLWTSVVLLIIALTGLPIAYKWATTLVYRAYGETEKPASSLPPFKGQAKVDLDKIVAASMAEVPDWKLIAINMPVGYNGNRPNAGIRTDRDWPRGSLTALTFDPVTGAVVQRAGFSYFTPGKRFWMWTRLLHTGEALGWIWQVIAGVAALGGLLLVYTGFALSMHRFFGRERRR